MFVDSGSVIGIGVLGTFISACLGKDFAIRVPPYREWSGRYRRDPDGHRRPLAGGCNVVVSSMP